MRAFGIVLAVTLILGLLASGISWGLGQTSPRKVSYHSGVVVPPRGGIVSGFILNVTDKVRDYDIVVKGCAPGLGYGSNGESVDEPTMGTLTVMQVQPGESRAWQCKVAGNGLMYVVAKSRIASPSKSWSPNSPVVFVRWD